ncbi:MAG: hypothetical protein Q4A34_03035 [Candidatus Saccharibacteria bacterium]|nr:hypothetical protein [Candidatus Saccharibacteria bacterium]
MRETVVIIGDTTWRMFVPAIGMTLVGVWLDGVYHTAPIALCFGIAIGFTIAGLLVKMQISRVMKRGNN